MNFSVIAATLSLGLTVTFAFAASDTATSESQRAPDTRLSQASPRRGRQRNHQQSARHRSHRFSQADYLRQHRQRTGANPLRRSSAYRWEHHSRFAHAQYYADRGEGSDRLVKGFQVRHANGRQYSDRRSSQPEDRGHHHQARSWTIEQACSSYDNSSAHSDKIDDNDRSTLTGRALRVAFRPLVRCELEAPSSSP